MAYVKHPLHGNRHVSDAEADAMVAAGWVKWPRPWAVKNAAPQDEPAQASSQLPPASTPAGAAPDTVDSVRAQLDARGIKYHPNAGLKKLQALLG
ncbi:MAG: hypothetical protein KIH64_007130 [Mycobacterium sp.]|nr:hypothetical protein [Mycobacterium sp.]